MYYSQLNAVRSNECHPLEAIVLFCKFNYCDKDTFIRAETLEHPGMVRPFHGENVGLNVRH